MVTFPTDERTRSSVSPQRPRKSVSTAPTTNDGTLLENGEETGYGGHVSVTSGAERVQGEIPDSSPGIEHVALLPPRGREMAGEGRPRRDRWPCAFVVHTHGTLPRPAPPGRTPGTPPLGEPETTTTTSWKNLRLPQRADGHTYSTRKEAGASFPA